MELKNDMIIQGRLESVDQFLNIKLADIVVLDEERYPHMVCYIYLNERDYYNEMW